MEVKRIKPAYFSGTFINDPKVLGSKVDEIIVAVNNMSANSESKTYVSAIDNLYEPKKASINITTSATKNYIILGNVDSADVVEVDFYLLNPGEQSIGDQIIIISQPNSSDEDITYTYDKEGGNFYISGCGDKISPVQSIFNDGSQERDVTIFTYDGEVFCATYDNC